MWHAVVINIASQSGADFFRDMAVSQERKINMGRPMNTATAMFF